MVVIFSCNLIICVDFGYFKKKKATHKIHRAARDTPMQTDACPLSCPWTDAKQTHAVNLGVHCREIPLVILGATRIWDSSQLELLFEKVEH
jgi:hypothetical protein